jgi:hypothetical protein
MNLFPSVRHGYGVENAIMKYPGIASGFHETVGQITPLELNVRNFYSIATGFYY